MFFEVSLPAFHELLRPNRSLTLEKDFDVRGSVVRDCFVFMYCSYIPGFVITTLVKRRTYRLLVCDTLHPMPSAGTNTY
jgi:hypothetical protein